MHAMQYGVLQLVWLLLIREASGQAQLTSFTYSEGPIYGQLDMTFSAAVDPDSCRAQSLTFQSSRVPRDTLYQIQQPANLCTQLGSAATDIRVRISTSDYLEILNIPEFWTNENNSYLSFDSNFLQDLGGDPVVELAVEDALQPNMLSPYPTPPQVEHFDIDMDAGILSLVFDQPVDIQTIDYTRITIQNAASDNSTLSNGIVLSPLRYALDFRFLMAPGDLNELKSKQLCSLASTCSALFMPAIATNPSGVAATDSGPMQVRSFLADVSPVYLTAFSLFDLDQGTITLSFSEPVSEASVMESNIQLFSGINRSAMLLFTERLTVQADALQAVFNIDSNDLANIKLTPELCTGISNCWIAVSSFVLTDTVGNPFLHSLEITTDLDTESVYQPRAFIGDTTPPLLDQFIVNFNSSMLVLVFDEPIQSLMINDSTITLQNSRNGTTMRVLSNSTASLSEDSLSIAFELFGEDFSFIIVNDLFSSTVDSYITITANITQDTSGNLFQGIANGEAFQATAYEPDAIMPMIVEFTLFDLERGKLVIQFSEPVDPSSVMLEGISIVSGPNSSMASSPQSFTLTDSTFTFLDPYTQQLQVILSDNDRSAIKIATALAVNASTTHLTNEMILGEDYSGNSVLEMPSSSPLSVMRFIPDSSPAELTDFELDLDADTLTLSFTDVVNSGTLTATSVQLLSSADGQGSVYTLTGPIGVSPDSNVIAVQLSTVDTNAIKADLNLATQTENTYLTTTDGALQDIEGREVAPVEAIAVRKFVSDTTPPGLVSFSLDLNEGLLSLTFSEPVFLMSFRAQDLGIQNITDSTSSGSVQMVTLQGGSITSAGVQASTVATIELLTRDLNRIKAKDALGTGLSDTFLSITSNATSDTSGNMLVPIENFNAIQIGNYVDDTTSPQLLQFTLSLRDGVLKLSFDEPVLIPQDILATGSTITLQNTPNDPLVTISLDGVLSITQPNFDPETGDNANELWIELSPQLLSQISDNADIANSVDDLFLSISTSNGISDHTQLNFLAPVNGKQAAGIEKMCPVGTYNRVEAGTCDGCADVCVDGCSGPLNTAGEGGCNRCSNVLIRDDVDEVTCLPQDAACPEGTYQSLNSSILSDPSILADSYTLCLPCHPLCAVCDGPDSTSCSACNIARGSSQNGGTATVECFRSCEDAPSTLICNECHPQCNGCDGPTQRDCVACAENSITVSSTLYCVPECTSGTYLPENLNEQGEYDCEQCNEECVECNGPSDSDCISCRNFRLPTDDGFRCVSNCPAGTYPSRSIPQCLQCHEQCLQCFGPTDLECTACVTAQVPLEDGSNRCIGGCSRGKIYDTKSDACILKRETKVAIGLSVAIFVIVIFVIVVATLIISLYCYYKKKKTNSKIKPIVVHSQARL